MTLSKTLFHLKKMVKRIWFRAAIYAILGILTAFVAYFGKSFVPDTVVTKIGSEAVGNILTILASSMLAVSTFSLSIMVAAFGQVASGATPRAASLLMEDQNSQSAVATFIGAFLYSIVGLITMSTGLYGVSGRFLLFIVTIGVMVVIIATLIRWVDQLAVLGRVGDTILKIEQVTRKALTLHAEAPLLGGASQPSSFQGVAKVSGDPVGFVSHIDMTELNRICEQNQLHFAVEIRPGGFVYPDRFLGAADQPISEAIAAKIKSCFYIEPTRSFQQDPRFGFVTLSEVASRALSAAVNDPGTAVEVMGASVRLFNHWSRERAQSATLVQYSRVFVPEVSVRDFFLDFFVPIARDGASLVEIGIKLQRSLKALSQSDPSFYDETAREIALYALQLSDEKLPADMDRARVREVALA